jgi:hypothetical protein
MKKRMCKLLLAIYLLPVLTFGQAPQNLEAEIKRVETGLIPPFTARMQALRRRRSYARPKFIFVRRDDKRIPGWPGSLAA